MPVARIPAGPAARASVAPGWRGRTSALAGGLAGLLAGLALAAIGPAAGRLEGGTSFHDPASRGGAPRSAEPELRAGDETSASVAAVLAPAGRPPERDADPTEGRHP